MTAGRCAGCGKVSNSCSQIRTHVLSCPDYIALYKADSAKALDPEAELIRFNAEENSDEARAEAKGERLTRRFAELDARRIEQTERWKPKDLLAD